MGVFRAGGEGRGVEGCSSGQPQGLQLQEL